MITSKNFRIPVFIAVIGILLSSCSTKTQYLNTWYLQDTVKTDKLSVKGMFYDNKRGMM